MRYVGAVQPNWLFKIWQTEFKSYFLCDRDSFVYIVVIEIVGENFLDGACVNEHERRVDDDTCIHKSELCVSIWSEYMDGSLQQLCQWQSVTTGILTQGWCHPFAYLKFLELSGYYYVASELYKDVSTLDYVSYI